ncbi:transposase [Streptomyces sp. AC550_RSS872]|uniref:transposase n=1 Tax=Streptomyces sp. AC550_RSS872 TaxID=2823689 RepID=UPI0020B8E7DB|nr:transposase [Streptomyces sp. AC550_RSS872]
MPGVFHEPVQTSKCPLSLPPRSGEQVPLQTVQSARLGNPGGYDDDVGEGPPGRVAERRGLRRLLPARRRPGLSPAQLVTVCVLQFVLGLSGRQAAEAVRAGIDFKYAMAMELDGPGFHHSVLTDFSDRLTEDNHADRLLDLALARLKGTGLVRAVSGAGRRLTPFLSRECQLLTVTSCRCLTRGSAHDQPNQRCSPAADSAVSTGNSAHDHTLPSQSPGHHRAPRGPAARRPAPGRV